jgi:hypothetical protein
VTVKQWDFPIDHQNDAGFRAWGSDLSVSLGQVGLVKTADTGQIDWVTVTRPANNTYAGYEIWRLPDSSLYIKWEYGTSPSFSAAIQIRVQVGTGSNGTGTLTGAISTATTITNNNTSSTGTSRRSWLSRDPSNAFFGFCGYASISDPDVLAVVQFYVSRTVDANTAPTTQGYVVYARNTVASGNMSTRCQGVDIQNNFSTAQNGSGDYCFVPFAMSSSLIGGLPQFFTHWVPLSTAAPRVVPQFGICTVVTAEIAAGVTFSANPIGAALKTFIAIPSDGARGANNGVSSTLYRFAMIWE